jgi:hypothetical protein
MLPSTLKYLEVEILQGTWQHGEEVENWYPNGLDEAIFKWDMYVPLLMKGLKLSGFFLNIKFYLPTDSVKTFHIHT